MNRCQYVVCIALFASATACSLGQGPEDEVEPGTAESGGKWSKPPKSPNDPLPADSAPPVDAPPPTPTGGGTPGFIDACLLPGMTKATFNPTGSIDAHDEGVTAVLNLPFPFTLYGTSHTKYWITTNGQLGFGNTVGGSAFGQVTCPLPDSRFTTPILLAYSADLIGRLDPDAGVCHATTGTAPHRKLVVTWKDSFFYDAWLTSNVTFSATLDEGTNVIDVVLDRIDAPGQPYLENGFVAVLGKQSGSSADAFSCYQAIAPEGTVIHYNP